MTITEISNIIVLWVQKTNITEFRLYLAFYYGLP
nr:MAG TPA: hypothetical protein [Caudoviricetes sp.]